jgi:hypothetical protein
MCIYRSVCEVGSEPAVQHVQFLESAQTTLGKRSLCKFGENVSIIVGCPEPANLRTAKCICMDTYTYTCAHHTVLF